MSGFKFLTVMVVAFAGLAGGLVADDQLGRSMLGFAVFAVAIGLLPEEPKK